MRFASHTAIVRGETYSSVRRRRCHYKILMFIFLCKFGVDGRARIRITKQTVILNSKIVTICWYVMECFYQRRPNNSSRHTTRGGANRNWNKKYMYVFWSWHVRMNALTRHCNFRDELEWRKPTKRMRYEWVSDGLYVMFFSSGSRIQNNSKLHECDRVCRRLAFSGLSAVIALHQNIDGNNWEWPISMSYLIRFSAQQAQRLLPFGIGESRCGNNNVHKHIIHYYQFSALPIFLFALFFASSHKLRIFLQNSNRVATAE